METKRKIAALSAIVLCGIVAHHSARRYMIDLLSCRRQDNSPTNVVAYSGKPRNADFFIALEKMLQHTAAYMQVVAGKDCVWLIGRQGVGKSTLANALCSGSNTIRKIKIHEEETHLVSSKQLFTKRGKLLFATGAGDHSITSYSEAARVGREVLVHCPGFRDTGGRSRDLINCIAITKLLFDA